MDLTSKLLHLTQAAILAAFITAAPTASAGEPTQDIDIRPDGVQVTGEMLDLNFSGVTHKGTYAILRESTGTKDYTETTYEDGRVRYKEGDLVAEGRWDRVGDQLCYRYYDAAMAGGCFYVYVVGNCYYYYSNNAAGIFGVRNGLYWTARSVKSGETASCEPAIG